MANLSLSKLHIGTDVRLGTGAGAGWQIVIGPERSGTVRLWVGSAQRIMSTNWTIGIGRAPQSSDECGR